MGIIEFAHFSPSPVFCGKGVSNCCSNPFAHLLLFRWRHTVPQYGLHQDMDTVRVVFQIALDQGISGQNVEQAVIERVFLICVLLRQGRNSPAAGQ